jgi:nitrate reductase NapE component
MKNIKKFAVSLFCLFPLFVHAELKEVPFTLDDRDRLIRTEQKVEALDAKIDMKIDGVNGKIVGLRSEMNGKIDGLRSEMNARFEAIDKRFDQLFSFLWAIIGIFTTMMVSVFGFAFWDRKLFLAPVKRENRKMLMALRDYAKHQPKLQEILKNAGLL